MKTALKSISLLGRSLLVSGLMVSPLWAATLDNISFGELTGERFEVRMDFSEVPPEPKGYTIEKPARIVMDFPDVESALEQKKYPLAFSSAKSAVVLSAGGRARLILNLNELATYNSRVEGNTYILEVGSNQVRDYLEKPAQLMTSVATQKDDEVAVEVTSIDFRRGQQGEGKLIIGLSDPDVIIDIDQTAVGIEAGLSNVWLPNELRRRLDVTDFATPVNFIDTNYDGSGVQLKLEAQGEYDYLAYQADGEYVISIKPLTNKEKEEKAAKFAFVGEKLSLNFQDIDVRAVLQLIADFTELNLVASDTVSGKITLRLDNVPWDQALDLVLKTKGLDKRQIGNVLMVAPAAEIAERERQEIETKKQLEELAPLRTDYIRVRYANAGEMFALFEGDGGSGGNSGGGFGGGSGESGQNGSQSTASVLSDRGSAIVDERTNSIIVTDTAERLEAFKKLVDQIDVPIRQVMIEARIVIANTDFRRELGIQWGGIGYDLNSSRLVEGAGSYDGLADPSPAEWFLDPDSDPTDLVENNIVDLAVQNPAGSFAMSFLNDSVLLSMEISALENSGFAEIVSQPKVITGDKQQATIESGTEIPYQEASASGATSTSFKEAVLKLDVTPQITPDDRIIMTLKINQDNVGEIDLASGIPTIDVTELNTQVLVANGQTVVLGGIFQVETANGESKVPFLGDIPYLGRLFKYDIQREEKKELLIFITPKILAESVAY